MRVDTNAGMRRGYAELDMPKSSTPPEMSTLRPEDKKEIRSSRACDNVAIQYLKPLQCICHKCCDN